MNDSVKSNLGQALRLLLKPLARLLIDQGITHREFTEIAKEAFVEMAIRYFREEESKKKVNRTRIAILTGLTRKEVANVLTKAMSQENPERSFSRPGKVLHGWHNDPRYQGPYGLPLEIPYEAEDKSTDLPSFENLVKQYGSDQSARQMLDELLRVSAVMEVERDVYKPIRRDFEPEGLSPKLIERFGNVGFNLNTTLTANIQKERPGKGIFDRAVTSNQPVTDEERRAFDEYLKERGQTMLEEIDQWLTQNVTQKPSGPVEGEFYETGVAMIEFTVLHPEDKESLRDHLVKVGMVDEGD